MPDTAVLASGGMDSSVLLALSAREGRVWPIYVETGMQWERAEQISLERYIEALGSSNVQPVTTLSMPARSLYGSEHWTMREGGAPVYDAPDETVYIPGRNIALITLASIWCSLNGVHRIAIGSLSGNPFPDATTEFFREIAAACTTGLAHQITIEAPLREFHKEEILAKFGSSLPLGLTLTCSSPLLGNEDSVVHCAECNKCRERHEAYVDAGLRDDTNYAKPLE